MQFFIIFLLVTLKATSALRFFQLSVYGCHAAFQIFNRPEPFFHIFKKVFHFQFLSFYFAAMNGRKSSDTYLCVAMHCGLI
jgi:hypothetical protein